MYLQKGSDEILRQSLAKLADTTDIRATSPGSVARAIVELVAADLGEFFAILDFNMKQAVLSTASGRSLDLWGALYRLPRKKLSTLAAEAEIIGAFYFYSESAVPYDITIPRGTNVYTNRDDTLGQQFSYATTVDVVIKAGRTRAYAPITNLFSDTVFTAAPGTVTNHTYEAPEGVVIKCTNSKPIAGRQGVEPDEEYRSRLIQEIRRQSGGSSLSLRLTSLAVPGVRDAVVREAVAGLGSVEVVVNAEDYSTGDIVLSAVQRALTTVRPPGVRLFVRQPTLMRLDVKVSLNIKRLVGTSEDQVKFRAKNAILRYINSLAVGEDLVYNRLISDILESSDEVVDASFTTLGVNGTEILRKNFSPKEDEHIVPGEINVQID